MWATREYVLKKEVKGLARPATAGRGSSLLDRRTFSGQISETLRPERVLTVRHYDKAGVVEFGWATTRGGNRRSVERRTPDREASEQRAVMRARAQVRRLCLSMGCIYMLTLTYHENQQDRKLALYHRQEFDRRMLKIYPWWQYVGVLERQKRGALHWHISTPLQVDRNIALREWRAVTGDSTITEVHSEFKPDGKGNAFSKLAGYQSKYLTKDMDTREFGQHRYHVCRGSSVPVQRFTMTRTAPRETVGLMIAEITVHLLGVDVQSWTAPVPAGATYGYMRAERRELQPKGGDG